MRLRGWTWWAGLDQLADRGLLFTGRVWDDGGSQPAWIIADSTRRNAQARRMDGFTWAGIGGKKAKTLPGSEASWPIGGPEIGTRRNVILCEGGPDFLAVLGVVFAEGLRMDDFAPVAMLGAGQSLHPDALPYFAGKHIRIAVQNDQAGRDAAQKWAGQLYQAGADTVDGFDFAGLVRADGQPVKDLADYFASLDTDSPDGQRVLEGMGACPSNADTSVTAEVIPRPPSTEIMRLTPVSVAKRGN